MNLREKVARQSPALIGVFVVIAVAAMAWAVWRNAGQGPDNQPPKVAYTTDDGKTFFYASGDHIAPFDSGGKMAVIGHLFRVDNGQPFVGWMEKYTDGSAPIVRRTMAAKPKSPESLMTSAEMGIVSNGRVYKMPGEAEWKQFGNLGTGPVEQEVMGRESKARGQAVTACDP